MIWSGDLDHIAGILGLKKSGGEYKGPCPVSSCGGKDRFHIRRGHTHEFIMSCRHGCSFAELAKACKDLGVCSDDPYDREQFIERKREEEMRSRLFTKKIYDNAENTGHKMNYKEKLEHLRLKKYADKVLQDQS